MHCLRVLLWVILIGCSLPGWAQSTPRIHARFQHASLTSVLDNLRREYSLFFAFDPEALRDKRVNVILDNVPADVALVRILAPHSLAAEAVAPGYYLVVPANAPQAAEEVTYTLNGMVRDALSGEALPFATIKAPELKQGASTNEQGAFSISGLPDQWLNLKVDYIGYQPLVYKTSSRAQHILIQLMPRDNLIEEVVIARGSGQRLDVHNASGTLSINPEKARAVSGVGEADILRTLQLLPGVMGAYAGAPGLFIRGGTPDQNLVRIDGITAYRVDHFFGQFSAFNNLAIRGVELHRGGFDARYGGRNSGLVEITGKGARLDRFGASASTSLLSGQAVVEAPIVKNKVSLLLAGRRSYSDLILSPFYQNLFSNLNTVPELAVQSSNLFQEAGASGARFFDLNQKFTFDPSVQELWQMRQNTDAIYNLGSQLQYLPSGLDILRARSTPSFRFYDINARLSARLSDKDMLSVSYYGAEDRLSYRYQNRLASGLKVDAEDRLNLANSGASMIWARQFRPDLYARQSFTYSRYSHQYQYLYAGIGDSSFYATAIQQQNHIADWTFYSDQVWSPTPTQTLYYGGQLTRQSMGFFLRSQQWYSLPISHNKSSVLAAAYSQYESQPHEGLKLSAGLRASFYAPVGKLYLDPRLNIAYELTPELQVKTAWGIYHQFVNRIRVNNGMGIGEDFFALANRSIIPVSAAMHIVSGFTFERNAWLLDFEVYHKQTDGLLTYSFGQPMKIADEGSESLISGGSASVYGADLLLQRKQGAFTGWLSYSMARVLQSFYEINMGTPFPAVQDIPHELKLAGAYTWGKRIEISGNWIASTGRPYTAARAALQENDEAAPYLLAGRRNAERLPAFHRLDISFSYAFEMGRSEAKAGISLYNLYNRKNVFARRFFLLNAPEQSGMGAAPGISTADIRDLGFNPNIFLEWRF